MKYDVIVIGGGHAGCEAALSCARTNNKTLLITSNIDNIADMPCNPSIGGPAKGIVVKEIDALGGEMAKNIDKSQLQMKMLNTKKGPAVRSLRAQADKKIYHKEMLNTLVNQENLDIKEDMVGSILVEDKKVKGISTESDDNIYSDIVIVTTGTYMKASILRGMEKTQEGPHGETPSLTLSDNLKELGFNIKRLKTGTPPRIARDSIDFSKGEKQPGDDEIWHFSYSNYDKVYDTEKQLPCYLIYTNKDTHDIINANLEKSSMYGGIVEGVGPRYCPSIEDKIVRFKDKESHQIFLEPESKYTDDIYVQGFSSSMPIDVQDKMIRTLPGLENCVVKKYAYAIEYDAVDSLQIKPSLETKIIENLYTAGQINGTSGYEEAACQGLIAGINASLKLRGEEPLILKRDEAYIGVLIDDLVTKGVIDPYRLLTSRAEYRLILRDDNADFRLREYGKKVGLVTKEDYLLFEEKKKEEKSLIEELQTIKLVPNEENNKFLESLSSVKIYDGIKLYDLLKRPEIKIENLTKFFKNTYQKVVMQVVETDIKYAGYIAKEQKEIDKMNVYENIKIPENINYKDISNLSSEATEKLNSINPVNLGQALRISGVNLNDIMKVQIYLKGIKNERK